MRASTTLKADNDVFLAIKLEDEHVRVKQEQEAQEEEILSRPYPAKLHAQKVATELHAEDGIVFISGERTRLYPDSDLPIPFRQARYFFYITGFSYPDCAVTYDIASCHITLWIPYVEPRKALYFGSPPPIDHIIEHYEVDSVRYTSDLPDYLTLVSSSGTPLFLLPHEEDLARHLTELPPAANHDTAALRPAMDRARVIKTPHEIALIRQACRVSAAGHRRIAENLLRMRNEREMEAVFQAVCTSRGAKHMAYGPIAGSGRNASTLHYDDNDQPLEGRALAVVDMGCEWSCYASDITRTLPLGGTFEGKAKEIHQIVEKMQEVAIDHAITGMPYYVLHAEAADIALRELLALGILQGDYEANAKAGMAAAFFPHGLGHHVGLEVHDVEGDRPLFRVDEERSLGAEAMGRTRKREMIGPDELGTMWRGHNNGELRDVLRRQHLQPGMVVTIEPGIYFCEPYIQGNFLNHPVRKHLINQDKLKEYYPVGGVRVEDVILVTRDGPEILSEAAPKGEHLEDVINGGKNGPSTAAYWF